MTGPRRPAIALVTDAIYPYSLGGREQRYFELLSRLRDHADLHVYTMNWWQGDRVRHAESATFHAVCKLRPMYAGGRRSIKPAAYFALGCLRLLTARFDVIEADHIPYLHILVLRLVATLRRKRLVVTWHEVWGREYWREYLGRAGQLAWLMEWLAMRLPDHIIAASHQTASRLQEATGNKLQITVAPNGIDLDTVRGSGPAGEPVDIVTVGRLIEHKRVDMLLTAVSQLHAAGYPVSCRIIGDGPDAAALRALAGRLGIARAVEFRADVREHKELYGLIKSARIAVFPSAREGFGIAVLEAIACGKPVITTSAPDNLARHLVAARGNGLVCESSAADLAAAMRQLLTSTPPAAIRADEQETRDAWLDEFGWDATAAAVAGALLR